MQGRSLYESPGWGCTSGRARTSRPPSQIRVPCIVRLQSPPCPHYSGQVHTYATQFSVAQIISHGQLGTRQGLSERLDWTAPQSGLSFKERCWNLDRRPDGE